jgi:hypothetical protein
MLDTTATEEIANDARARANVLRLAAAQALTGANSAVIFATGSRPCRSRCTCWGWPPARCRPA